MKKGPPTMRPVQVWSSNRLSVKTKQVYKTFNNLKVTLLCGVVTILVLRGTIGLSRIMPSADESQDLIQGVADQQNSNGLTEQQDSDNDENELDMELDSNKTYALGPKISNWNEQRRSWLLENPDLGLSTSGRPRVLLVTGSPPKPCDNPAGDHYLLKAIKNKIDYCRVHEIELFYSLAHLDAEMAGYWSKLPLIRKLMLSHPEIEWIWWMDSDAILTDMRFELPLSKYKDYNLILHGWEKEIYEKRTWTGLNTGSLLIRNCQWSLDLLDAWAPMGPRGKVREEAGKILTETLVGRPEFEADDQSALIYLLITQKELWGNKVYLENSYYLHGYWVAIVEKFDEVMEKYRPGYGDERWPFVTHFVGCKPCGSYGDYSVEKCLKEMERSFNFGDNQILQMYGFQHRTLDTFKVKRTRNESDHPLEIADKFGLPHTFLHQAMKLSDR